MIESQTIKYCGIIRTRLLCLQLCVVVNVGMILIGPSSLFAQSTWIDRSHTKTIFLELLRPIKEGFTASSLGSFFSLRTQIATNTFLLTEIPLAHAGFDRISRPGTSTTLGNPYVGGEVWDQDRTKFVEFGLRVPTAREYGAKEYGDNNLYLSTTFGVVSAFDRFEAFTPNTLSIVGMFNYNHRDKGSAKRPPMTIRLRGGPVFLFNTDPDPFEDRSEVWLNYSVHFWDQREGRRFSITGGVTGRMILTEEGSLGDRTIHQFGFAFSFSLGQAHLGTHFRLPIAERGLDPVFGLNFGLNLE